MKPLLNVRYVLISDYATVDHTGKLIVAGLYTEDLVVPSIPALLATMVVTVLVETPESKLNFRLSIEAPSGTVVMGGGGELGPLPNIVGSRPRAVIGFQFNNVGLSESGDYKIMITNADREAERFEIHRFRLLVNSAAHAEATGHGAHVSAPADALIDEQGKRRSPGAKIT